MKIKYKVMVNVVCPAEVTAKTIEDEITSWLQDIYEGECTSIVLEGEQIEEKEELELLDPEYIADEVYDILDDYLDVAIDEYAQKHGFIAEDVKDKIAQALADRRT